MKSPQTSLKLIVYWISYFINYKTSWKFSNAHAFIFIFKKGIVSYWKYSVHYNFLWVYIGKCRFERIVSPTSLDPLPTINEGSITPEYIEVSSDFQFRAILWSDKHFAMQIIILFFSKELKRKRNLSEKQRNGTNYFSESKSEHWIQLVTNNVHSWTCQ